MTDKPTEPAAVLPPVTDHEFVPHAAGADVCQHYVDWTASLGGVPCGRPASEHRAVEAPAPQEYCGHPTPNATLPNGLEQAMKCVRELPCPEHPPNAEPEPPPVTLIEHEFVPCPNHPDCIGRASGCRTYFQHVQHDHNLHHYDRCHQPGCDGRPRSEHRSWTMIEDHEFNGMSDVCLELTTPARQSGKGWEGAKLCGRPRSEHRPVVVPQPCTNYETLPDSDGRCLHCGKRMWNHARPAPPDRSAVVPQQPAKGEACHHYQRASALDPTCYVCGFMEGAHGGRVGEPAKPEAGTVEGAEKVARSIHRYIDDGRCSTKVQCRTCTGIAGIVTEYRAAVRQQAEKAMRERIARAMREDDGITSEQNKGHYPIGWIDGVAWWVDKIERGEI